MMNKRQSGRSHEPLTIQQTIERIQKLADGGNLDAATALLRDVRRDKHLQDALGVCLLRRGHAAEAVRLYRDLVLAPGCTWMKPDLPTAFKLNYATALLLDGRPSGCLAMLSEINQSDHPTVIRLRTAIEAWERTLDWWPWLNWKLGRIDPYDKPVRIDFPPGEFTSRTEPLTSSDGNRPDSHCPTAA